MAVGTPTRALATDSRKSAGAVLQYWTWLPLYMTFYVKPRMDRMMMQSAST